MAKLTGKWLIISNEIEALLKSHDIKMSGLKVVNYGLGESTISMKVQQNLKDETGADTNPQREAYKKYCRSYGMELHWLDTEFTYAGQRFKLNGFNMSKPKNIISMISVSTGKTYIAPLDGVKNALIVHDRSIKKTA